MAVFVYENSQLVGRFWFSHIHQYIPSGYVKIVIENHHSLVIVDFPIDSMVIFHSFLYVYQRVSDQMIFSEFDDDFSENEAAAT